MAHAEPEPIRPLTAEERKRGLAAMAEARRLREEILRQRGEQLFPSSWETIEQLRDERSQQLK